MKKLLQIGILPLLTLLSGLFAASLFSVPVHAADGLASIKDNCIFRYNTEKTVISVSCKSIRATDDDSDRYGDSGDVTFGSVTREFTRKTVNSHELVAKYSSTSVEDGGDKSCTSKITIADPKNAPANGTISGDFIVGTSQAGRSILYDCKLSGSVDIGIDVGASNDNTRRNAAAKALLAAIKKSVDKVCPVTPPAANNQECVDNWNAAVKTCHNKVWAALTILIINPLADGSKYGTMDNLSSEGKRYYLTAMQNCLKDVKDPLGQPMFTNSEIKQVITTAAVEAMATGSTTAVVDEEAETTEGKEETTTCAIDGIGWIVCPVMNFMSELNDQAFSFIEQFLQIRPDLYDGDSATYTAWKSFRDIANVLFVVAFMFIVYSQITSVGISNYGVKKLLPKIFVAALLVNVSYWVCAVAIDISNIAGSSIYSLFENIDVGSGTGTREAGTWTNTMGPILAAGIGIALLAAFVISLPALLAFAMVMLILIGRQAFIVLLIVVAPIAFVAYLLPNTEQWFKKWWKALMTTIMVYPIVALVFGASSMASEILFNVAGDDEQTLAIVALGVLAIPLFAIPLILKGALSAAGSIGSKLSGMADKTQGAAGSRARKRVAESRLGEAKSAFDARRQGHKVEARLGKGRMTRAGNFLQRRGGSLGGAVGSSLKKYDVAQVGAKFDESSPGKFLGGDRGAAAATSAYHKLAREEMERQESTLSEKKVPELLKILSDTKVSTERRAAAARRIAQVGGDQHVEQAFDYMMTQGAVHSAGGDAGFNDVQQLAASELLKRKPSGISTSQANAMNTGTLANAEGYYSAFKSRVQEGKFGAKDYASMQTDDLVRLAEMATSTNPAIRLSDEDIAHIMTEYSNIEGDETLKGTLTDERKNLFTQISARASPTRLTGEDYGLATLNTP